MRRQRPKERLPEQRSPGAPEPEPCAPGSIEQQLDMCETGTLRGDEVVHHPEERTSREPGPGPAPLDRLLDRFQMDMSEEDREGDEISGDEHSAGLQGGEQEIEDQLHLDTGLPGDETRHEEIVERKDWEVRDKNEEFPEGAPRHVIRRRP